MTPPEATSVSIGQAVELARLIKAEKRGRLSELRVAGNLSNNNGRFNGLVSATSLDGEPLVLFKRVRMENAKLLCSSGFADKIKRNTEIEFSKALVPQIDTQIDRDVLPEMQLSEKQCKSVSEWVKSSQSRLGGGLWLEGVVRGETKSVPNSTATTCRIDKSITVELIGGEPLILQREVEEFSSGEGMFTSSRPSDTVLLSCSKALACKLEREIGIRFPDPPPK